MPLNMFDSDMLRKMMAYQAFGNILTPLANMEAQARGGRPLPPAPMQIGDILKIGLLGQQTEELKRKRAERETAKAGFEKFLSPTPAPAPVDFDVNQQPGPSPAQQAGVPPSILPFLRGMPPKEGMATAMDFLKPTTLERQARAAGFMPGTAEYQKFIRDATMKPDVSIKQASEIGGLVQEMESNRAKYQETGNPKYKKIADALEMRVTFGGKPPQAYVTAKAALTSAREGLSNLYSLVQEGTSSIMPSDRAKLSQAVSQVVLAFATLKQRGANFTGNEERLITGVIGGDPNNVVARLLRGDQSYLDSFKKTAGIIEREGKSLLRAFTTPSIEDYSYPWEGKGQPASSKGVTVEPLRPPPKVGDIEDGYEYTGGDPGNPSSWRKVQ